MLDFVGPSEVLWPVVPGMRRGARARGGRLHLEETGLCLSVFPVRSCARPSSEQNKGTQTRTSLLGSSHFPFLFRTWGCGGGVSKHVTLYAVVCLPHSSADLNLTCPSASRHPGTDLNLSRSHFPNSEQLAQNVTH